MPITSDNYDVEVGPGAYYAVQLVNAGWNYYRNTADTIMSMVTEQQDNLQDFEIPSLEFELSYDFSGDIGTFVMPTIPSLSISAFDTPDFPVDPTIDIPTVPALEDAPEEPTLLPYAAPTRPDVEIEAAPDTVVTLETLTLPDEPTYDLPSLDAFHAIVLPDLPDISLPVFEAEEPEIDELVQPESAFNFTEEAYSSSLLTSIQASLADMIAGNSGLPAAVEQALFGRLLDREDAIYTRTMQETYDDFATRGFEEPNGILASRIARQRQENQNKLATANREVYIQAQQTLIEQLRFGVTQGIALEQSLLAAHLAVQERAFLLIRYGLEAQLQVFNAQIAKANLQYSIYQVKAAVYRDQIQAELAKAEVYKAQIDGQRLVGELNQQLVQRYVAQFEAIDAMVKIYLASIDAVKARGEINMQRVEVKRNEIEAYKAKVMAVQATWEGFKAQVEGELGIVKMNEVSTNGYLGRLEGWKTRGQFALETVKSELQVEALKLQKFDAQIQRAAGQVEAEKARVGADVQVAESEVRLYAAQVGAQQTQVQLLNEGLRIKVDRNRADADLQIERARLSASNTVQRAQILLEATKAAGNVSAQLAASAFNAVNLSASAAGNGSESKSSSINWNISGETDREILPT